MDMNLNPHNPQPHSPCLGWNILKMSLVYFPYLFYRIDKFVLILVNWVTDKIKTYCFISRSFSSGNMKCYMSGTICKTAIFWNSNRYIFGNMRKIATFWNLKCYICGNIKKIATFLLKVLHFLGNLQICYF